MRAATIRKHLAPYSIQGKRATTIAHAFASAIAPADIYDEARIARAMRMLGQRDPENLACTYCKQPAETWDHLFGLVHRTRFSGHGHTLGNLIPCCRACNSKKGNKDWRKWVRDNTDEDTYRRVTRYAKTFGAAGMTEDDIAARFPEEMRRLVEIKGQILALMAEADKVAAKIRAASKPVEA